MKRTLAALVLLAALLVTEPAHAATGPDYAATISGPTTVTPGGEFTRTLTVTNLGDDGGRWPVTLFVRGIYNAFDYVSTTSTEGICSTARFSSGVWNYSKCWLIYLAPGESQSMTVTFRATTAAYAWMGWQWGGGGNVAKTSMELDAVTANNYASGVVTVLVPA